MRGECIPRKTETEEPDESFRLRLGLEPGMEDDSNELARVNVGLWGGVCARESTESTLLMAREALAPSGGDDELRDPSTSPITTSSEF